MFYNNHADGLICSSFRPFFTGFQSWSSLCIDILWQRRNVYNHSIEFRIFYYEYMRDVKWYLTLAEQAIKIFNVITLSLV